ncbi:MAG: putative toxin-antitoxin system toxin component, PIN family [Candidatus Lindowbacteria bacterium]|nr:putative toxin-antitoxin system toxin component, PIN family [Candidatus Lindowbacteria bacterium]
MTYKRVVLDTNVVISALLFKGRISMVHTFWMERAFTIVASREIMEEYVRVLAYPKFNLTESEIKDLLQEELMPYIEPVAHGHTVVLSEGPQARAKKLNSGAQFKNVCVDPDDDKFLACAQSAKADAIVSGDAHLLSLRKVKGCPIVTVGRFLREMT